ncbi:MAG: hypothetical protein KBT34_13530 [Prevotella sp.]|nr:hypothetical protein [Candidatus Prevotella equi]
MVREYIHKDLIGEAFNIISSEAKAFPDEGFSDRLEQCRTEFHYMSDFMMKGYNDDKRSVLFTDLKQRILDLWYDIRVRKEVIEMHYIKNLRKTLLSKDTTATSLQAQLLSTTDEREHHEVLSLTFLSLLTSYHWKNTQVKEWFDFLASSETNVIDAATLTSAISLSCMLHFSASKAICLAHLYEGSEVHEIRQRAFVGCILSISHAEQSDQKDVDEVIRMLLKHEQAGKDLLEMQMQMLSCANADKDSDEIRKNLMPNILRNQPFTITKDGIVEREEEEDCIDTDASERRMEEMESSIKQMLKLQKNGADIFFEGFSQMKRFPFFYKMANWFMPFYLNHPDIATYIKQLPNTDFIQKVTTYGPFCNSDKYSFAIAFSGVMNQLPENVREMMKNGEIGPIGMHKEDDDLDNPSLLRLQYLQDLYRFFRLNPIATDIPNPYNNIEKCKAWTSCRNHLKDEDLKDMCLYLLRKSNDDIVNRVVPKLLNAFKDKEGFDRRYCIAEYRMRKKEYEEAIEEYSKCLTLKRSHNGAMRGIAKAYYAYGNYELAEFYFDALHMLFPDRKSYFFNYIMSKIKSGQAEDILNELYRMEFEDTEDKTTHNLLAWALLYAGKAEQALSIYERYDSEEERKDLSVVINHAYALMFTQKMQEAIELLKSSTANTEADSNIPTLLQKTMMEDADLLNRYNFGEAERAIIIYSLQQ